MSFWDNLKESNPELKFEASESMKHGFPCRIVITDKVLYTMQFASPNNSSGTDALTQALEDKRRNEPFKLNKDKSRTEYLDEHFYWMEEKRRLIHKLKIYLKEHKSEIRAKFEYTEGIFYGTENSLEAMFSAIPEFRLGDGKVTKAFKPSCQEAEQMLKDGWILQKTNPVFPYRAKTKAGRFKVSTLAKVARQVELSPDRYHVSNLFKQKAMGISRGYFNGWSWVGGGKKVGPNDEIYIGSSNICFKQEHDIAIFALMDPTLSNSIQKIAQDPIYKK